MVRRARRDVLAEGLAGNCRFELSDIASFSTATRFDASLNWFTSIGYGTRAEDVANLASIGRATSTNGIVIVEVETLGHLEQIWQPEFDLGHVGGTYRSTRRLVDGLLIDRIMLNGGGKSQRFEMCLRVYTLDELVTLAEDAGLKIVELLRGDGSAPASPDERVILVCKPSNSH
jgi:hypothetical protein